MQMHYHETKNRPQSIHISCQTSFTMSFSLQNEPRLDEKHIFYGALSQMGKLTCGPQPKSAQNYILQTVILFP